MPAKVVIGGQYGDEGKGTETDRQAEEANDVVRYNGGHNAGHTVTIGEEVYKLHLVPSGIVMGRNCYLGSGVVIDPLALAQELTGLEARGIDIGRLRVSGAAHVILPYDRVLDCAAEVANGGKIGTTGRGIGPTYAAKARRDGVRVWDFASRDRLAGAIVTDLATINPLLRHLDQPMPSPDEVIETVWDVGRALYARAVEILDHIPATLRRGEVVLLEGAQGTFIDIDYGTYPFVSSSHTTAGGALLGTGVGITDISDVTLILKAYTTRVGSGPFIGELTGQEGNDLRCWGAEYGTTTGRDRRCAWFDIPLARTSVVINRPTKGVLTKLDVLSHCDEIPVIAYYRDADGYGCNLVPSDTRQYAEYQPVMRSMPGWGEDISDARTWDDLPDPARRYVEYIEGEIGIKFSHIGVGPERNQVVVR